MSIQAQFTGGIEPADTVAIVTADTKTDIYTGAKPARIVAGAAIINTTGSAATVTLYRGDGTTDHTVWRAVIAANSTTVIEALPLPLSDTTHKLKAESTAGSSAILIAPFVFRQGSYSES